MDKNAGVNFPLAPEGGRASTSVGKDILARAVRRLDPALAAAILAEGGWRMGYPAYFERVLRLEAQSAQNSTDVATTGLEAARERFVYVDAEAERPVEEAYDVAGDFRTVEIQGDDQLETQLLVPYKGKTLRGNSLLRQLDEWVARGITEPSFAEAVGAVVRHPEWLDLRGRTIGMAGAASEMGPFHILMSWGATVAAIDLPRPAIWERLARIARESAGRMLMPIPTSAPSSAEDPTQAAGANLFTDVGPLVRWLLTVPGPLTLGNYGYADAAAFVRISMAVDLLMTGVLAGRDDLSVTYLATPSDVFLVPVRAVDMADRRHDESTRLARTGRAVNLATRGHYFRPNYKPESMIETPTNRFGIVNAFILEQGQNYALAKKLQRWRMLLMRQAGVLTSVHVAPPTRTKSVHKNPVMQQRGALTARLGIETFDSDTTQVLGAAILVHDLNNPASPANPATPLGHPEEAFMFAANPGGRWRVPFEINSAVPLLQDVAAARMRVAGLGVQAQKQVRRVLPG